MICFTRERVAACYTAPRQRSSFRGSVYVRFSQTRPTHRTLSYCIGLVSGYVRLDSHIAAVAGSFRSPQPRSLTHSAPRLHRRGSGAGPIRRPACDAHSSFVPGLSMTLSRSNKRIVTPTAFSLPATHRVRDEKRPVDSSVFPTQTKE
ncbi:MAG: hypothetical protein JXA44_13240 [Methanospirillaceae archaeon]|nr:hypothetical protein [Methanospirillaceae archaeon]